MFLWFLGGSWLIVAFVFQSPGTGRVPSGDGAATGPPRPTLANLDFRTVMVGSVVPLLDGVTGGPWLLHTLLGAVAVLTVVMLATRGRRLARRRLLGIPIGMLLHLVLDGVWADKEVFWWPAFGSSFGTGGLPELDQLGFRLVLEVAGAVALVYAVRLFGLDDPAARRTFVRTGQLPRR